jgi:NTP pyrophosphatase (non-canonical NTP hydrolase)
MKTTEYERFVGQMVRTPVECSIMGLAGEAGEVVDLCKKHLYHDKPLDHSKLTLELGDALFYLTDIARQYGISLDDVMAANVDKLTKRFPQGHFTPEDANRRADEILAKTGGL